MRGTIDPLVQYSFPAWFSVKAQVQLYIYLYKRRSKQTTS